MGVISEAIETWPKCDECGRPYFPFKEGDSCPWCNNPVAWPNEDGVVQRLDALLKQFAAFQAGMNNQGRDISRVKAELIKLNRIEQGRVAEVEQMRQLIDELTEHIDALERSGERRTLVDSGA